MDVLKNKARKISIESENVIESTIADVNFTKWVSNTIYE